MKRKLEEIQRADYVICEICTDKIYDYEITGQNYFCSCDCYSVYVLSNQQTYLHEKPLSRTFSSENLDNEMEMIKDV